MRTLQTLVQILALIGSMQAANILIFAPLPLFSHTYTFMPVFRELASRGHNVTMMSPFSQGDQIPNWTEIKLNISHYNSQTINEIIDSTAHKFYTVIWRFCTTTMEDAFQNEGLQNFIKYDKQEFDLIIMEPFFCQESLIALGHKLKAPIVAFHPMSLTPWFSFMTGNPISLTSLPNLRSGYSSRMSFFEKLDNFVINIIEFSINYFLYTPAQEALMDKYVTYPGYENRPSMMEMLRNVSVTLIDYHFSVGYNAPLQPNSIPVGGLSLKNAKQLPTELKDIMDNAKDGVIYFSFGSVLQIDHMPKGILETFLATFGELKQTVFVKWGTEDVPNIPKNVILRKWFPQASILAHPNVRLFITHTGLHSLTEASYLGVPILCVPFFADQVYNSRFAEEAGFGLTIRISQISKEKIIDSIQRIISDPRFKASAVKRSRIVRDRPETALESAVYWIEYVLRHGGADHLKPAMAELQLYQVLSLDLVMFFAAVIATPLLLIKVCKRRGTKSKKD